MDIKKLNEELKQVLTENEPMQPESENNVQATIDTAIDKYIAEHGNSFEIYVDYNDTLEESTIKKIFDSETPFDAFYEIINDWDWWESADYEYKYILEELLDLDEDFKEGYRYEIMEALQDKISYEIPYSHFDETVFFDVLLHDKDDANVEYNNNIDYDEKDEDGTKHITGVGNVIAKLIQSQGYSVEDFVAFLNGENKGNEFFESLYDEFNNSNDFFAYSQPVFLVQASLLDMAKAIQEQGTITIQPNCVCGLTEPFNGSCGMLDMKLEKPITGKIIDKSKSGYEADGDFDVNYYHGYSYSVDDICGLVSSAWKGQVSFN